MTSAPLGSTKPEAGVMATRPATAPEAMPSTLGLPWTSHSENIQASAAMAVAICVTAMAMPAEPLAATAEPALKPNQPTHSKRGADHRQDEVERRHVLGAVAGAPAKHEAGDEPGDAGVDVNDRAAGEVENASAAEEAAAPHPMADRGVDEDQPQPT